MSPRLVCVILLATMLGTSTGRCCEPVLPLLQLLTGSSVLGPGILTQSLFWLFVAIALKSGAFVWFEKRLSWRQAAGLMLIANVVSTIPGILLAVFSASGTGFGILIALPVVFFLGWIVQRRMSRLPKAPFWARATGGGAMFAFAGFSVASMVLYYTAQGMLETNNYRAYWAFKFTFVTLVAGTGIVISAVLEECVIAGFTRKSPRQASFYASVFRANYVTLGAILLVAAVKILPQRLQSPHFITTWIKALLGVATG